MSKNEYRDIDHTQNLINEKLLDEDLFDEDFVKPKSKSKAKDKSHTLDYYSDDLSKKVVGRLYKGFELKNKSEPIEDSIVFDYRTSEDNEQSFNKKNTDHLSSNTKKNVDELLKDITIEKVPKNSNITQNQIDARKAVDERLKKAKENKNNETVAKKPKTVNKTKTSKLEEARKTAKTIRITGIIIILILLVLAIRSTFKISSLNKEIETLKIDKENLLQDQKDYSLLKLENEDLKEQLWFLTETTNVPNATQDDETETETETKPETEEVVEENKLPASYTVKSGDNLSKISDLFYGDPSKYYKIVTANNIDPNTLYAGQQLIIPE